MVSFASVLADASWVSVLPKGIACVSVGVEEAVK